MAESPTQICNLAISHLGHGKEIQDITTDESAEARACRRFYETVRDMTLKSAPWSFAKKVAGLGLVEATPNLDWQYSYRYPSDCLLVRKILNGYSRYQAGLGGYSGGYYGNSYLQVDFVPFELASDVEGQLIFTDQLEAWAEYTWRVVDVSKYTSDFTMAFSMMLGAFIAPRITSGDNFKKNQELLQQAQFFFDKAATMNANERKSDPTPESEFTRARY